MPQSNKRVSAPFEAPVNEPLVSVIIPSKNSEQTIAECIRSIRSQSYTPIEVIVVDSFSTDSTREIALKMGALVVSTEDERSLAKNFGAKFANGKYLFFVDADHRLDPTSITVCAEAIVGSDGVLVTDQDVAKRFCDIAASFVKEENSLP